MDTCPCCSSSLLRHVRHNTIYWYCQHCHQEMPNLESIVLGKRQEKQSVESWLGISQETSRWFGSNLVEIIESAKEGVAA